MASFDQARLHYQFLQEAQDQQARLRAQEQERAAAEARDMAARQARSQAERDQLLAGYSSAQQERQAQLQAGAAQQAAGLQSQRDREQFGYQNAMFERQSQEQERMLGLQEGIQARRDTRQVDLQARLNEITLTQGEQIRQNRLKDSMSRVRSDPTLAPHEREAMITQLQTGLNPLENRAREAQTIQTHLQSQAIFQQNEQSAILFNQRQQHLARGIEGNLQTITDPNTGISQLFYADHQGNPTALTFGRETEAHQATMAGAYQNLSQGQQMFQPRLQSVNLSNQQAQFNIDRGRQLLPGEVRMQGLTADRIATDIEVTRAMTPWQINQIEQNIIASQDENWRRNDIHPEERERIRTQNQQALVNLAQSRMEGPARISYLNEQLESLRINNDFSRDTNPVRRDTMLATLTGIQNANQLHAQTMPALVQQANLQVQRLMDDIQNGRAIAPHQIAQAQASVHATTQAAAGQYLRNALTMQGILTGTQPGHGSVGGGTGAGVGPGGQANRIPPAQLEREINNAVRTENQNRVRLGQQPMTQTQEAEYRRVQTEMQVNGVSNLLQELRGVNGGSGMTIQQAEIARQLINNSPQWVREAVGQAMNQATGAPNQTQPQPQPSNQAQATTQPGETLDAPRNAAADIYKEGSVFNRIPGLEGPVAYNVGRMHVLLSNARRANRRLNPEERNDYEYRWATLPDNERRQLIYPGMLFHGSLDTLNSALQSTQEAISSRGVLADGGPPLRTLEAIRHLLRQAVEQRRGLTSSELERYNTLRGELSRERFGLFRDQTNITTAGPSGFEE